MARISIKNVGETLGARGFEHSSEQPESPRNPTNRRVEASQPAGAGDDPATPEAALARAIQLAAEAGQWDVVAELARQLTALRGPASSPILRVIKNDRG